MHASSVVIGLVFVELPLKIDRIPEEHMIQIFAPDRADQSFHEWVRHRDVGYRLDLLDPEDPYLAAPAARGPQWPD